MVHHKGSSGAFGVLLLADLLQAASLSSSRASGADAGARSPMPERGRGDAPPRPPSARHAGRPDTRGGPLRARGGGLPWQNAPWWPAASCSPTDCLRSTIGARGLNFRVRDGTGCASPAMAAGRQGAFCCFRAGRVAVPSGPHSVTGREASPRGSRRKSSAD